MRTDVEISTFIGAHVRSSDRRTDCQKLRAPSSSRPLRVSVHPHERAPARRPRRQEGIQSTKPKQPPRPSSRKPFLLKLSFAEVRTGFEPAYNGFANRCLTAWLPHRGLKRRGPCHGPGVRSMAREAGLGFRGRWGRAAKKPGFAADFVDRPVGVASGRAGGVSFGLLVGERNHGRSLACFEP